MLNASQKPGAEAGRLPAIKRYHILDTLPEPDFDDLVQVAAHICEMPIALLALQDGERYWLKAHQGLDLQEISFSQSFCRHGVDPTRLLIVPDTSLDPQFCENPFVVGEPHIRFYAGAPLVAPDGVRLGTLCVIDRQPRHLTPEQQTALMALSRQAAAQLEMRKLLIERQQTERMTQTILQSSLDGYLRLDAEGHIRDVNEAYCRMTGYRRDELLAMSIPDLEATHTASEIAASLGQARNQKRDTFEVLHRAKDGHLIDFEVSVSYLEDTVEGQGEFCVFYRAITERKKVQEALRRSESHLSLIFSTVSDLLFLIQVEPEDGFRCLSVNAAYEVATGFHPKEVQGKLIDEFLSKETADVMKTHYREAIRQAHPIRYEEEVASPNGQIVSETTLIPILDGKGHCTHLLGKCQDITEQKALEAEQERQISQAVAQADRDPLTNLYNHRVFQRRLMEEADRAQREGTSLAIAMLDLDNFKFFNDSYGHLAGDDVLRRVADGLRQNCRSYDILARFGGDEFAVLMPAVAPAEIEALKRRLVSCLDGLDFWPPGHDVAIPLGLSIGVAIFPDEAASRLEAVDLADARLRMAKSGAGEAALAAERLRERLTGRVEGFSMLDALVTAVDNKDRYTRRHSEDVLTYSSQIAQGLGLDEKTQYIVEVAALLHDVGKIGVPDAILRKPGRLTPDEFSAIQQHPMMGAIIVGAVPGFEEALDAVRHHHERWDGEGYPFGLRGTETPLIARLMAVADAFSAMTTDRPYRKGMPEEQALAILARGSGSQWDPACVSAFLQVRQHLS